MKCNSDSKYSTVGVHIKPQRPDSTDRLHQSNPADEFLALTNKVQHKVLAGVMTDPKNISGPAQIVSGWSQQQCCTGGGKPGDAPFPTLSTDPIYSGCR